MIKFSGTIGTPEVVDLSRHDRKNLYPGHCRQIKDFQNKLAAVCPIERVVLPATSVERKN